MEKHAAVAAPLVSRSAGMNGTRNSTCVLKLPNCFFVAMSAPTVETVPSGWQTHWFLTHWSRFVGLPSS